LGTQVNYLALFSSSLSLHQKHPNCWSFDAHSLRLCRFR